MTDSQIEDWVRWAAGLAMLAIAWLHRRLWSKQETLEERLGEMEADMSGMQAENKLARLEEGKFRQDVKESLAGINTKLDRIFHDERARLLEEIRDLRAQTQEKRPQ